MPCIRVAISIILVVVRYLGKKQFAMLAAQGEIKLIDFFSAFAKGGILISYNWLNWDNVLFMKYLFWKEEIENSATISKGKG